MKRNRTPALVLAALLLYAASYLAAVRRGHVYEMRRPGYVIDNVAIRALFAPAQWLDRSWARPRYWAPPACVY
jgi:hypothetical protein